jgi:hypothetical protein
MKLFLLEPRQDLPHNGSPWDPWYDKCFGMVVRAENETHARKIADANGGSETITQPWQDKQKQPNPWLDKKYSTCEVINEDGDAGLVLQHIWHA